MNKYAFRLLVFFLFISIVHAADMGTGIDHPSRWGPDYNYVASQENRFNVGDANTPLPAYQSAVPDSASSNTNLTLRQGFFNRIEFWQRVDSRWFLSQYAVVNDTGQYVGQIDAWTADIENRGRTRADLPWQVVAHWDNDAMRLLRMDDGTTVSYEVKYPLYLVAPDGQAGAAIDRSINNGKYTDNGFNIPLSVGDPVAHVAMDYSAANADELNSYEYQLILGELNDSSKILLGSATVAVVPVPKLQITVDAIIRGFPPNVPCVLDFKNLYPHSRTVVYLILPSGDSKLIWDSVDQFKTEGDAKTTTPFSYSTTINLAQYLVDAGNYTVECYSKTPITQDSGVTPPQAVDTQVPGYWSKLSADTSNKFTVLQIVNFKGNLIELQ